MKNLSFEQMENTKGGWRLFGYQTTCGEYYRGSCECTERFYFFGIGGGVSEPYSMSLPENCNRTFNGLN
jgi:hypothetical protein